MAIGVTNLLIVSTVCGSWTAKDRTPDKYFGATRRDS